MNDKTKRYAFIHYPHQPEVARLETMPFAYNAVVNLAQSHNIDLYLWEPENLEVYRPALPSSVNLIFLSEPKSHRFIRYAAQFAMGHHSKYHAVFAVGQIGLFIGAILAKKSRSALIYFNDEFPSQWKETIWSQYERRAAKQASLIVVPDQQRVLPLCHELYLSSTETEKFSVLPNIPRVSLPSRSINWHKKLSITENKAIFLHAGSLADWGQVPEILSSVPYWPANTVLLLHSRKQQVEKYQSELSHLNVPGRVVWSKESLNEVELNSLVGCSTGCFALYRNLGPNIKHMGFASGKLMRSLACGIPVITSRFKSMAFVEEARIGELVLHPAEIPSAINNILKNLKEYKINCVDFVKNNANFDTYWDIFFDKLSML